MEKRGLFLAIIALAFLLLQACAATTPLPGDSPLIPLEKANLEMVLEEQEGLEIAWENAKEVRDFYRGGVQQKAQAEKKFQEKAYSEALKLYDCSNEFFLVVLKYINHDSAEYQLFEGNNIIFMPNLLIADNYLKTGRILKGMGRESSARGKWKRALPYVDQSLRFERTEWGQFLRQELLSALDSKGC